MVEMEYNFNKREESVLLDKGTYNNHDYIIMNVRHDHPCCYIAIPNGNKFHEVNYNDIPLDCHGGLTYGSHYSPESGKEDSNWYIGWDYAHLGDHTALGEKFGYGLEEPGHRYSTKELLCNVRVAIDELIKLENNND